MCTTEHFLIHANSEPTYIQSTVRFILGFCPILPATYVAIGEGQYEANAGTEPVSGEGETSGGSPLFSFGVYKHKPLYPLNQ